jgi:translation initiation factor IF-3
MTHRELGSRILEKLEKDLADVGEVEARPRMEGNQMFIILGPKRHKSAAKSEHPPAPAPAAPVAPAAPAAPEPSKE